MTTTITTNPTEWTRPVSTLNELNELPASSGYRRTELARHAAAIVVADERRRGDCVADNDVPLWTGSDMSRSERRRVVTRAAKLAERRGLDPLTVHMHGEQALRRETEVATTMATPRRGSRATRSGRPRVVWSSAATTRDAWNEWLSGRTDVRPTAYPLIADGRVAHGWRRPTVAELAIVASRWARVEPPTVTNRTTHSAVLTSVRRSAIARHGRPVLRAGAIVQ